MKLVTIPISKLHTNNGQIEGVGKNPRFIRDEAYEKIKKSIIDDPEMLELREIIAYDNNGEYVVILGNQRYRALKELGYKDAIVKILPPDTPKDKIRAFIIKDNTHYGNHDFDALANEWDAELLDDWGLDVPGFTEPLETKEKEATFLIEVKCNNAAEQEKTYNELLNKGYSVITK